MTLLPRIRYNLLYRILAPCLEIDALETMVSKNKNYGRKFEDVEYSDFCET